MSRIFEVNYPLYHGVDSWDEYDGYDAADAAMKFGTAYNEDGDYSLMNEEIYVRVRDSEGIITMVCISAESDIHYSSNEMTKFNCKECETDLLPALLEAKEVYHDQFCNRECYCK